ncbi:MAG TPA: ThuA domain-containing protein [Cyclobacteriaceae bacterium]|nr:ThuA domain-containing protein [Cyclobacteriaceae bacterium]HRJ83982.1 ThuA domain-containing protein [Cyclobacteriaceae bacterium]
MNTNRRSFLTRLMAAAGMASTLPLMGFTHSTPYLPLPSLKGRKILFTHGGWDGHEPQKFVDYLVPWMKEEGADVLLHHSLDVYTNKKVMDTIDLVVQIFTMSQISKEQEAGLLESIKVNGTGIAGWHGGLCDAFRNNTEYQYMTGGQWVSHPGGVIDYRVNIIDKNDALTQGLSDFNMTSEQYFMHIDPNVKVLATTRFTGEHDPWIDGSVMPVAWKKMYGKGRIFYTSLGHNLAHLIAQPDAVTLLKRGIQWASASKYDAPEKWLSPVYAR